MEDISGIDFGAVDEIVNRVNAGGYSFSDYVKMIISDGGSVNYRTITDNIINTVRYELSDVRTLLAEMIFVVIIAAVYVNISRTFRSRQVSETGFYITYMFMFML
ncbi:MAG: stage III sporulation protein AE, partial [Lachnospiraceae bacterium]|nr:stage III sporulation protein AE [Lachnospiraceae bacterium]